MEEKKIKSAKKRLLLAIITFILIAIVVLVFFMKPEKVTYKETEMNVVLSLEDKITNDTIWCGTFNLIWNDLKNELAKQDIIFNPQLEIIENLNKGTFNINHLSESSYYKKYGHPTLELKSKIEEAIKEKFNETSDILDDFEWNGNERDYILYVMLKKEFEFPQKFTELDNGTFNKYEDVKYFGINSKTDDKVRKQVEVIYYEDEDNFALKLKTKTNDEVIIAKGIEKTTFKEVYEEITTKEYNGISIFQKNDTLKIPNISFKIKKEFEELYNKKFYFSNGEEYIINKALQTIEFELDKSGGRIKSEAGMGLKNTSVEPNQPRNFNVDDTFVIFLKETGKELPYFGAKITNIKSVQV